MAEGEGFEPSIALAIPLFESGQFNHSCTLPELYGTPGKIRTYDLWLRKPTLYPAELRVHTAVR